MSELNFRGIEITDKPWIDEALKRSQFRGCEYTFGNNFVWRRVYSIAIARLSEFYFVRWKMNNGEYKFSFPAGGCDIKTGVELLREYSLENNIPLKIYANKAITEKITSLYPRAFTEYSRDSSDYIYLAEELEELKGKKFHAKRNHLNRFYENDWSFEPLTMENLSECIEMNERWCAENICSIGCNTVNDSKEDESCIVRCSFKYFDKLNYSGGVIRVNGAVQAFCFGEPSSDDTFVVHVEKALKDYQGAYAAINHEFVKSLCGRYKYINREDDTGAENLRKAKLSYNPVFLEDKFDITFGG